MQQCACASNAAEAEVAFQEDRTEGVTSEETTGRGGEGEVTGTGGGLHMATEASSSLGRLWPTCSSCPESDTS